MRRAVVVGLAVVCVSPFGARPLRAQVRSGCTAVEEARVVALADRDRAAGAPRRAIPRLTAQYARCPSPWVLAQQALAELSAAIGEEAAGVHTVSPLRREAFVHLTEALTSDDRRVREVRGSLDAALQRVRDRLPQLSPQTNVPGATLRVDGAVVGALPLREPHVLLGGAATIELAAPGYVALRRTVTVTPGEVFREMLTLVEEPPPRPLDAVAAMTVDAALDVAADVASAVEVGPEAAAQADVPVSWTVAPDAGQVAWQRVAGWSALGVGVAALIGGAVSWGLWVQDNDAQSETEAWRSFASGVNANIQNGAALCDQAEQSPGGNAAAVAALCADNRRLSGLAIGLTIGGVVAVATGAVLLLVPGSTRRAQALRVTPWWTAGAGGAVVDLRF
jgi:hypothetical protein